MKRNEILRQPRLERIRRGWLALGISEDEARRYFLIDLSISYAVETAVLREKVA